MIVVGIIGILVSVAVPQFNKYQRKARQSEAKIALAAIYGLEKSFYSEYSAYIPAFDAIGYTPEGSKRFYHVTATADSATYSGSVTGYSGAKAIPSYAIVNTPWAWSWNPPTNTCVYINAADYAATDPQVFVIAAYGNLYPNSVNDMWNINHIKVLTNCGSGI